VSVGAGEEPLEHATIAHAAIKPNKYPWTLNRCMQRSHKRSPPGPFAGQSSANCNSSRRLRSSSSCAIAKPSRPSKRKDAPFRASTVATARTTWSSSRRKVNNMATASVPRPRAQKRRAITYATAASCRSTDTVACTSPAIPCSCDSSAQFSHNCVRSGDRRLSSLRYRSRNASRLAGAFSPVNFQSSSSASSGNSVSA